MKHMLISILAVVAVTGAANADNKDKADALFKQGKKQMGEKRYADACESFEKSYKLDPGIGAQLNIAKCYEEWGKLGRAFTAYQLAEQMAKDAKDSREPKIHALIVKLEPNVPHLTIMVPKGAPSDLQVTLDNRPVETLGEPFVVDPGPHTIEWSVKGGPKQNKIVALDRGAESEVTIDVGKLANPDGGDPNAGANKNIDPVRGDKRDEVTTPKSPGRNQRLGGIALAGGGVVAIGISSYLTLSAKGRYDDALAMHCGGMSNNCDMTGLEITRDARSTANKATIVFLVGVAMVGGGAALYFLAPKGTTSREEPSALYLTPSVSPDGVGVVFGGKL
jgi:tetratricopeptide (TPR) repeat protein